MTNDKALERRAARILAAQEKKERKRREAFNAWIKEMEECPVEYLRPELCFLRLEIAECKAELARMEEAETFLNRRQAKLGVH